MLNHVEFMLKHLDCFRSWILWIASCCLSGGWLGQEMFAVFWLKLFFLLKLCLSHEKIFQHGFAILDQSCARQYAWAWPCMLCWVAWRFAQRHFRENISFEQGGSNQSCEESVSWCRGQHPSRFCGQHGRLRAKRFFKAQIHDQWQEVGACLDTSHCCSGCFVSLAFWKPGVCQHVCQQ